MSQHVIFTMYPAAGKIADVPEGFSSFWEGFDSGAAVPTASSVEGLYDVRDRLVVKKVVRIFLRRVVCSWLEVH